MELYTVLFIAVGLAMDASAVCVGVGATPFASGPRPFFRLSFHFGLFQALMPVLGWLAGASIAHLISSIDHWIALILLSWVGLRMVREGFSADSETHEKDPSRGRTLVMLSIATSIDAFAVGLSLAMLQVSIAYPAVIIGVITAGLSLLGILLGRKLGEAFGKRMEIVGGMILVAIGLRILMSHLTAA